MNWDNLSLKKMTAPFVPKISHELDVGNFADEFTTMAAEDSPAIVPMDSEKIFKVSSRSTAWFQMESEVLRVYLFFTL